MKNFVFKIILQIFISPVIQHINQIFFIVLFRKGSDFITNPRNHMSLKRIYTMSKERQTHHIKQQVQIKHPSSKSLLYCLMMTESFTSISNKYIRNVTNY